MINKLKIKFVISKHNNSASIIMEVNRRKNHNKILLKFQSCKHLYVIQKGRKHLQLKAIKSNGITVDERYKKGRDR